MYKVIFDADGIVYRVGFALEDVNSLKVVNQRVQEYIDYHLSQITKAFVKVDQTPIIVTSTPGQNNFRFELAKTLPYKGNRTSPKPKHYENIRKILSQYDSFVQIEGQEADDTIADLVAKDSDTHIVVSQDKDLLQNPGWYYIPGGTYVDLVECEDGDMVYTEVQCTKRPIFYVDYWTEGSLQLEMTTGAKKVLFGTGQVWLAAQMLLGDPADNIPGVPKYGAVKVMEEYRKYKEQKIHSTFLEHVKTIYMKIFKEIGETRFWEIYNLLKIGGHKK